MRRAASGDDAAGPVLAAILTALIRWRQTLVDVFVDVLDDALADDAPKLYWHCVSNQSTEYFEMNRLTFRDERIVPRETLQDCALAQRNSASLRGMPEPS